MQTVIFSQNVFTSQNLCYAQFTGWRTTVQWMVPPYHTQIEGLSIECNKKQFNTVFEIRTHLFKFHDMQNNYWKLLKYSFHKKLNLPSLFCIKCNESPLTKSAVKQEILYWDTCRDLHEEVPLPWWQVKSLVHTARFEQVVVLTDEDMSVRVTRDIHQDLQVECHISVVYMNLN